MKIKYFEEAFLLIFFLETFLFIYFFCLKLKHF